MKLLLKEQTWRFLRTFFLPRPTHHVTASTLTRVMLSSLKLFPVAIAAQAAGMLSLCILYWHSGVSKAFICVWLAFGVLQILLSLKFTRSIWKDRDRVRRIRTWLSRWTALSIFAGILWAVAGTVFVLPETSVSQVLLVAVIVAVTFASWPVYSCWLPSLTAFAGFSLAPVTIAVSLRYGVSQLIIAAVILVTLIFILYSGRKLHEIVVTAVLTDVQNHKLVERLKVEVNRSEEARRFTEAESRRRAKFFAAANHDLRQPLQAMGIYLDILKRRSTPQTAPVIEQLSQTTGGISTLVEQVLTVTRMEFGQMELHPEHVSVQQLLNDLAFENRAIAGKKGLTLRVHAPAVTILTDPGVLRRALQNLISNAVAYSNPAAPKPEIVLGARRIGEQLIIGIYDCGQGISKDDQDKIFGTFYRGAAGKAQPGSGYGLGLSIVKGLAKQLGARLSVGSRPGRGSVFRLAFSVDESEQADRLIAPVEAEASLHPVTGRIALLEDNRFVREALAAMLESWGATVTAAGEPAEAFYREVLAHPDTAVLVSDYNLGEGMPNGLAAGGELERRLGRRLPMILLTAVSRDLIESDWRKCRAAGEAVPAQLPLILQKPADGSELNDAVRRLMAMYPVPEMQKLDADPVTDSTAQEGTDGSTDDMPAGPDDTQPYMPAK